MSLRVRAALALALFGALALADGRAQAYVQYRTSGGIGWTWQDTNCMPIVAYSHGSRDMTPDEVAAASTAAAAAWSKRQHPCTYLTVSVRMSADPTPDNVPRRLAVLVFREERWCKMDTEGRCSASPEDAAVYDDSVLVLTSSEVNNRNGAMTRAGIEVNAVDFTWADIVLHPERASATTQDLQNALTHEVGHFIGLDHNCTPTGTPSLLVDERGEPAPECDTAPPEITEATMFPTAPWGDLGKRTLAADDEHALCDIYPVEADPMLCGPPWNRSHGCTACSTAPGAPSAAELVVPGVLAGLGLGRTTRRRVTRRRR